MVECKKVREPRGADCSLPVIKSLSCKAQPKEVMLPLQLNKTRAAAARNLYGLAPEQLLAYASYIPRLPAGAYGPPTATAAHHHGMALAAYPGGVTAAASDPPLVLA